ncbi:hypothetical protein PO909_000317 [Leuciscus waleckii]
MDGDAGHVPVIWISAVLDELIQKLGDQRVFVLSVLGVQSSGKSTMLNAMFGLQFAVSAGRCTRGAFMQLVRVSDEMKPQMNFDYILVVDTEGLRSLELAGRSTRHHDNELATFVVGLGNLTLINIFGENPSEMQDVLQIVVQAFLRMKKVKLNPSCVFVHQNISDVTAGEKYKEGGRRLQETLDEMTKLAAKEEVCDEESFSDVIRFDVKYDVMYVAQLWEGSPPMAPPNPNYCENIHELKETIMSHASNSHGMMLQKFSGDFRLETEYSKWTWSLRCAMMETENKLHNRIKNEAIHEVKETDLQRELKKTSEEVKKSMSELFEKEKYILIQWKTTFAIRIKELQENIDGLHISCIQQLICYIKARVTEHQDGSVKYVFKNEFFMDLVISICKRANKTITDQHRKFRDANDPVIYVEKKRENYYSIFQKYCHGATSAANLGEIICQKLKEPIEQSVYKKTSRDLRDEMRSNCPSLNTNRSNLEKHILKTLAEEEDFNKYMNYIHKPRDHFKSFIRQLIHY